MIPEMYVLYIALLYHTVVWAVVLRVVDAVKDGGKIRDLLCFRWIFCIIYVLYSRTFFSKREILNINPIKLSRKFKNHQRLGGMIPLYFTYILVHTFMPSHSYNSFIHRQSQRFFSFSSSPVSSVGKTSPRCRAGNRTRACITAS
jgi:hypothetical protein